MNGWLTEVGRRKFEKYENENHSHDYNFAHCFFQLGVGCQPQGNRKQE